MNFQFSTLEGNMNLGDDYWQDVPKRLFQDQEGSFEKEERLIVELMEIIRKETSVISLYQHIRAFLNESASARALEKKYKIQFSSKVLTSTSTSRDPRKKRNRPPPDVDISSNSHKKRNHGITLENKVSKTNEHDGKKFTFSHLNTDRISSLDNFTLEDSPVLGEAVHNASESEASSHISSYSKNTNNVRASSLRQFFIDNAIARTNQRVTKKLEKLTHSRKRYLNDTLLENYDLMSKHKNHLENPTNSFVLSQQDSNATDYYLHSRDRGCITTRQGSNMSHRSYNANHESSSSSSFSSSNNVEEAFDIRKDKDLLRAKKSLTKALSYLDISCDSMNGTPDMKYLLGSALQLQFEGPNDWKIVLKSFKQFCHFLLLLFTKPPFSESENVAKNSKRALNKVWRKFQAEANSFPQKQNLSQDESGSEEDEDPDFASYHLDDGQSLALFGKSSNEIGKERKEIIEKNKKSRKKKEKLYSKYRARISTVYAQSCKNAKNFYAWGIFEKWYKLMLDPNNKEPIKSNADFRRATEDQKLISNDFHDFDILSPKSGMNQNVDVYFKAFFTQFSDQDISLYALETNSVLNCKVLIEKVCHVLKISGLAAKFQPSVIPLIAVGARVRLCNVISRALEIKWAENQKLPPIRKHSRLAVRKIGTGVNLGTLLQMERRKEDALLEMEARRRFEQGKSTKLVVKNNSTVSSSRVNEQPEDRMKKIAMSNIVNSILNSKRKNRNKHLFETKPTGSLQPILPSKGECITDNSDNRTLSVIRKGRVLPVLKKNFKKIENNPMRKVHLVHILHVLLNERESCKSSLFYKWSSRNRYSKYMKRSSEDVFENDSRQ